MPSTWPLALLVSLQFFRLLHGYSPGYNTPCDGRSIYIYLRIFLFICIHILSIFIHIFTSHVMQSHVDNCIIFYRNSHLRVIRAYMKYTCESYQCSLHSLDLFSLFALSLFLLSFMNCRTVRCGIIKNTIWPSICTYCFSRKSFFEFTIPGFTVFWP